MTDCYYSGTNYAESMVNWLPYKLKELGRANLLDDGPFVDFGCGLGTVIAEFQKKYLDIQFIGIDRDQRCLDEARKIVLPNTRLLRAPLNQTSLEDDSIAIAFSHKIYQLCNEENYSAIAEEIHRTLKRGGVYCASEPMQDYKHPFLELGLVPIYEDQSIIFRK